MTRARVDFWMGEQLRVLGFESFVTSSTVKGVRETPLSNRAPTIAELRRWDHFVSAECNDEDMLYWVMCVVRRPAAVGFLMRYSPAGP